VLSESDPDSSWERFLAVLETDIDDAQGDTTGEGIQLGVMAGTVDLGRNRHRPVAIAADPAVHAEPEKEVDRVNRKCARIDQVKRFASIGYDLSQSDEELTPTLKVKRAILYDTYGDVFAGLYEPGR
jgi:long-subunit acyl-CoA synthetase (AMP-forming)